MIFVILLLQCYKISAESMLQTIEIPDWQLSFARNSINNNCSFDRNNNCIGTCPLTSSKCQKLIHFDETVCGCSFCSFDSQAKKCSGQCPNTFLETCVSKISIPKDNSDCICAGCLAKWSNDALDGLDFPSCDESTCYPGNSCSPIYVSKHHVPVNRTLYCQCNNNNTPLS